MVVSSVGKFVTKLRELALHSQAINKRSIFWSVVSGATSRLSLREQPTQDRHLDDMTIRQPSYMFSPKANHDALIRFAIGQTFLTPLACRIVGLIAITTDQENSLMVQSCALME